MIGLVGAALWLVAIGTVFTIVSLALIGTSAARFALAGVSIATIIFLAVGVGVLRAVLRTPGVAARTTEGQIMARRFKWVVIGEVAAIMIVNGIASAMQYFQLIAPLDILIVGIHFFPLASLFRVPRYYWMGGFFCAVTVLTLVLVPAHAQVGAAGAWLVWPTFGCSLVAWVTAGFNLREVRQSLREQTVAQR
jgi:hypothetical protein